MKRVLGVILIFLFFFAQAQEDIKERQISFSINEMLFYNAPRYTMGYMFPLKKESYFMEIQLGYGPNRRIFPAGESANIQSYYSFIIEPQILKELSKRRKSNSYLGVSIPFVYHFERFNVEVAQEKNKPYYKYYDTDYRRIKMALNLNYIFRFSIYKSLKMWLGMGIGLKYRNVKYYHYSYRLEAPYYEEPDSFNFGGDNMFIKIGSYINFNFNSSIRLAYAF